MSTLRVPNVITQRLRFYGDAALIGGKLALSIFGALTLLIGGSLLEFYAADPLLVAILVAAALLLALMEGAYRLAERVASTPEATETTLEDELAALYNEGQQHRSRVAADPTFGVIHHHSGLHAWHAKAVSFLRERVPTMALWIDQMYSPASAASLPNDPRDRELATFDWLLEAFGDVQNVVRARSLRPGRRGSLDRYAFLEQALSLVQEFQSMHPALLGANVTPAAVPEHAAVVDSQIADWNSRVERLVRDALPSSEAEKVGAALRAELPFFVRHDVNLAQVQLANGRAEALRELLRGFGQLPVRPAFDVHQ